ncbi:GNAT family N-acetyltransferase [Flavobacterium branchiarum]|uniref:GNAT family N-acetyltransferase n=1 Tax=Flavobacterium branchiarum TaxID=1114870 RepID=A0ABV5FPI2_9FLAO|nr:GNAT family N-acetyltransferase [Flavobacterium branchiarum]MDN3675499.1 GNAT family N-acetyltransferase [Flavobacterium branchiarum]
MEYIIRDCETNDLTTLVKLCQKHAEYEQATYNQDEKKERLTQALFSKNPKLYCLIVEVNTAIIGYATYTIDYSTWDAADFMYMDCLYLEDTARGFGIGEAIIEKLKQIAIEKNCINIQWQTPTFNTRAVKFYNRIGASGKDKVRFSLTL